jgi:serine/threonine protein kinase
VLLFELLAGYPAFCADEPVKVYSLVLNASPSVPRSFPREAKELLGMLLRPSPHTRLGAMRGGLVDVACHGFFEQIDWLALLSRKVEAPLIPVIAEANAEAPELAKLQAMLPVE